jgi:hypothetical protein
MKSIVHMHKLAQNSSIGLIVFFPKVSKKKWILIDR